MLYIPTIPGAPVQRLTISLDGRNYTFTFKWNNRDTTTGVNGSWRMSIQDDAGNVLLRGIKLAIGETILRKYRYMSTLPPGRFSVVDTSDTDVEPALDDLGDRVLLAYEPVSA